MAEPAGLDAQSLRDMLRPKPEEGWMMTLAECFEKAREAPCYTTFELALVCLTHLYVDEVERLVGCVAEAERQRDTAREEVRRLTVTGETPATVEVLQERDYAWECAENMKGWAQRAEETNRSLRAALADARDALKRIARLHTGSEISAPALAKQVLGRLDQESGR